MAELVCPYCNGALPPRATNTAFPFCSQRCRSIDLGAWLAEDYRVPVREDETERDGPGEEQLGGPQQGGRTEVN